MSEEADGAFRFRFWLLRLRFSDGIPVLANDFSQSAVEGPRMLPSINASPGQRVQVPPWTQTEQPGKSRMVMDRTSFIWGEWFQMSKNFVFLTFPVGSGN
jgi:hypothetical protein